METPSHSARDPGTSTAREEKLLSDLQADVDEQAIALYERMYADMDPATLPRTAAILKLQILNLARLTLDILNTAEFLVEENDHLKAELAILQSTASEYQE